MPREKIDKRVLYARQEGICTYCDEPLSPNINSNHHDHVHPLRFGGWDVMENSALLHASCNQKKGRRMWGVGIIPKATTPSLLGAERKATIAWWKNRSLTSAEAARYHVGSNEQGEQGA